RQWAEDRSRGTRTGCRCRHVADARPRTSSQHHRCRPERVPARLHPVLHPYGRGKSAGQTAYTLIPYIPPVPVHTCRALVLISPAGRDDGFLRSHHRRFRSGRVPTLVPPPSQHRRGCITPGHTAFTLIPYIPTVHSTHIGSGDTYMWGYPLFIYIYIF